jgi:hypothetical protein
VTEPSEDIVEKSHCGSLIMSGGVLVSEGERNAPEQPAPKWARRKSTAICHVSYFSVQSREKCIRMPPVAGEMQITPAAASDG